MSLNKLISKIKKYLKQDNLSASKQEKVKEILEELYIKKEKIKKEIKACDNKCEKEKLQEKLEAVIKLIKKSKKLI